MTDNLTLKMDADLTLRDVVFMTLREAILRGDLKPGERLMELQLASKLGVSRTPIREAIHMLEQEGLAVTVPRRGAEVARMTLKDMEDVLEIREALDELAVRLAIDKISPEQLEQLRVVKKDFEMNTKSGDIKKIAEADVKFHDIIYEATDNPKLVSMLSNFRAQAYRYRVEYLKDANSYPVLIREHEAIVESIETKDEKKAMQAMHEHVANQALAVKAVIERQDV
jgi:DNA-binding GntR family transcriptional regulator